MTRDIQVELRIKFGDGDAALAGLFSSPRNIEAVSKQIGEQIRAAANDPELSPVYGLYHGAMIGAALVMLEFVIVLKGVSYVCAGLVMFVSSAELATQNIMDATAYVGTLDAIQELADQFSEILHRGSGAKTGEKND